MWTCCSTPGCLGRCEEESISIYYVAAPLSVEPFALVASIQWDFQDIYKLRIHDWDFLSTMRVF